MTVRKILFYCALFLIFTFLSFVLWSDYQLFERIKYISQKALNHCGLDSVFVTVKTKDKPYKQDELLSQIISKANHYGYKILPRHSSLYFLPETQFDYFYDFIMRRKDDLKISITNDFGTFIENYSQYLENEILEGTPDNNMEEMVNSLFKSLFIWFGMNTEILKGDKFISPNSYAKYTQEILLPKNKYLSYIENGFFVSDDLYGISMNFVQNNGFKLKTIADILKLKWKLNKLKSKEVSIELSGFPIFFAEHFFSITKIILLIFFVFFVLLYMIKNMIKRRKIIFFIGVSVVSIFLIIKEMNNRIYSDDFKSVTDFYPYFSCVKFDNNSDLKDFIRLANVRSTIGFIEFNSNEMHDERKRKIEVLNNLFREIKTNIATESKTETNCEKIFEGVEKMRNNINAIYQMGTALNWHLRREKVILLNAISDFESALNHHCSSDSKLNNVFSDSITFLFEYIEKSFNSNNVNSFRLWPSVDILNKTYLNLHIKDLDALKKGNVSITPYASLVGDAINLRKFIGYFSIFLILLPVSIVFASTNRGKFFALFAVLIFTSSCKRDNISYEKEYIQAKRYIENGENYEAKKLFSTLVKRQPENPNFLYGYALSGMLYNLQRTGELIQMLFKTIKSLTSAPPSPLRTESTRIFVDALLEAIFRIIILNTADDFVVDMSKFFKVADDSFIFDIQKMTISFFVGGKSIEKFTVYGKHGIEEANLLYATAQLIRTVIYSILSLSFNVDIRDVLRVYNFTQENGGMLSFFAYPLTVGFPSLMYLVERNQNVLTAPFKEEQSEAKKALVETVSALYKYSSVATEKFSKGLSRDGFMFFLGDDGKTYIKSSLGDQPPKRIPAGQGGIEGLKETVRGAKSVLESLEGKGLVLCDDISGPIGVFMNVVVSSGLLQTLSEVAEQSAPEEAKTIARDFYRSAIYYLDWVLAIYSACTKDAFLFDFSKLWIALENLREAIPVWFSFEKDDVVSRNRNLLLEWECQTSTYDLKIERLERNFNWLLCAKKSVFEDSEHFSKPITLGKGITSVLGMEVVNRENPLSKNPLPKDGIPTPYPYIILPDPSFKGFLHLNTKVLWPNCNVPCGFSCEVVEPEGMKGLCLVNATLAKIGNYIYGVE